MGLTSAPRMPRLTVASCAIVLLCSCGAGAGEVGGAFSVTDSAGIEIAWSPAPVWATEDPWVISEEPTLEIGSAGDDPAYLLYQVWDARRLGGGRIAVANSGSHQVRFYDATGRHLQDIGGEGDGPGEFQFLRGIWPIRGDSLMTFDLRQRRVSVFDAQGNLGRTVPLVPHGQGEPLFAWRAFDDGTLLAFFDAFSTPRATGLFPGRTRVFNRYSADGELLNEIARKPHGSNWGFITEQGTPAFAPAPMTLSVPPLASDGESVYLGDGAGFEVEKRTGEGNLIRLIRWSAERQPVPDEVIERHDAERIAGASPEGLPTIRRALDGMPFPDQMPPYQSFMTDDDGYLWVEEYRPFWETVPRWWVFDPSGRWLGELTMPTGFELLDIGVDYVLGVRTDVNDVEYVAMHALTR